jgi:hypothetical protein
MHQLSQDERVASIQALVIYTIIRMTDSGVQYFSKNTEMVRTMKVSCTWTIILSKDEY